MNKAFTPIGLIVGLAAGQVAKKIFDTRHGWAQLTGAWPGEERPEEE